MRLRLVLPALLLLVPLVGCGSDNLSPTSVPPTSDASGSASSLPATDQGNTPGGATGSLPTPGSTQPSPILSRTDLTGTRVFEPDSVIVDPTNDRRLLIRFWGGVTPCFGVEIRAVESATDVKVTVLSGSPPEGRDKACIAIATYYQATVDLKSPLGTRTIVVMKS